MNKLATQAVSTVGGGLLGAIKALLQRRKARQEKLNRAVQTAYSPFTGFGIPAEQQQSGPFENIVKGALGGLELGQKILSSREKEELARKMLEIKEFEDRTKMASTIQTPELGQQLSPFSNQFSLGKFNF